MTQKMWVVCSDREGYRRLYHAGREGDFTSRVDAAACWHDRRDAERVARYLQELYPTATIHEECVDMAAADPTQQPPRHLDLYKADPITRQMYGLD